MSPEVAREESARLQEKQGPRPEAKIQDWRGGRRSAWLDRGELERADSSQVPAAEPGGLWKDSRFQSAEEGKPLAEFIRLRDIRPVRTPH